MLMTVVKRVPLMGFYFIDQQANKENNIQFKQNSRSWSQSMGFTEFESKVTRTTFYPPAREAHSQGHLEAKLWSRSCLSLAPPYRHFFSSLSSPSCSLKYSILYPPTEEAVAILLPQKSFWVWGSTYLSAPRNPGYHVHRKSKMCFFSPELPTKRIMLPPLLLTLLVLLRIEILSLGMWKGVF